jgi:transcriptional regulator PpsR
MRCIAVNAGEDGRVIAIGRDHRLIAELQQRLVEAQQATEREHQRVREAESRYRLLFQLASEAVLVVDAGGRKVVEANPSAERLVGGPKAPLVGASFVGLFDEKSSENAGNLLALAQSGARLTAQQELIVGGRAFNAAASFFRQERSAFFLVRLLPLDQFADRATGSASQLLRVMNRMPDAFVVTDESLNIVGANDAFIEMARFASHEQAVGQSLEDYLGRPDTDRNILVSTMRKYGVLKNFATIMTNRLGEREDVDVAGAFVTDGDDAHFGFTIRAAVRGQAARAHIERDLPRSVEQLSQLVGRATLKELVRETTDLVERLCIEAALELTGNNRASAAEVLGLSRQSLYSKLHRHGLAEFGAD